MGKYSDLKHYLTGLKSRKWTASFADIEGVLGFTLPASAYKHPEWWSNSVKGHSHAHAWIDAGWITEKIKLGGRQVTFRKVDKASEKTDYIDPFGMLEGTVTVLIGHDLTQPLEEDWLSDDGKDGAWGEQILAPQPGHAHE